MQRINDGPLSHALYHWPFPFEIVRSLVYNSISNQATKISISLQTSYCVSVVDNGCGFPVQFKLGEPDPLKKPHGYGQTLKMVSLLGELGIYSKGKRYFGPHTLATRDTRVVVDKLYSKVPARRRFIDFTIEDRKIKGLLSKLSIRFHGVTFTYRFASKSEIIWDRFGSSLQRFKYEFGMDRMYNSRDFKWISTDESFSISGFSSATPEGCPERKLVCILLLK